MAKQKKQKKNNMEVTYTEESSNFSCMKSIGVVDHSTISREFKMIRQDQVGGFRGWSSSH